MQRRHLLALLGGTAAVSAIGAPVVDALASVAAPADGKGVIRITVNAEPLRKAVAEVTRLVKALEKTTPRFADVIVEVLQHDLAEGRLHQESWIARSDQGQIMLLEPGEVLCDITDKLRVLVGEGA